MPSKKNKKQEAPLTLNGFISFYKKEIKPQLDKISDIESNLDEFKQETSQHFDNLYKKYEKLERESLFTNHQMKRADKRADKVVKDLTEIKGRIGEVEGKINKVEGRLDNVERKIDKVEGRLDKIETKLDETREELKETREELSEKIDSLGNRIKPLEKDVNQLKSVAQL
jgi:chromosome segregation ATPase